jgi:hypothetical protein
MIKSPVLIVGCARSGTTLLYNVLSETPQLWSIGYESKAIIERYHHPAVRDWVSGELDAGDLTAESRAYMLAAFAKQAAPGDYWRRVNDLRHWLNGKAPYATIKRRGRSAAPGAAVAGALPGGGLAAARWLARARNRLSPPRVPVRLLEKTPENCLRLPFLAALFPDARVLFLTRDGRANVHSLLEGWRQPHLFPGYRPPAPVISPGQTRGRWAFTLIPGWRDLVDSPLEEICAWQWVVCNEAVLAYAAAPGALPLLSVRYEDLVDNSEATLAHIADFLGFAPDAIQAYGRDLPEVNTVSWPDAAKWQREGGLISQIETIIGPTMARLGYSPASTSE